VFGGSRLYVFPLCNLFNWVIGLGCSRAGGVFFFSLFLAYNGGLYCFRWIVLLWKMEKIISNQFVDKKGIACASDPVVEKQK
jgi:hypothetical protein